MRKFLIFILCIVVLGFVGHFVSHSMSRAHTRQNNTFYTQQQGIDRQISEQIKKRPPTLF